jgi:hypothetical protein
LPIRGVFSRFEERYSPTGWNPSYTNGRSFVKSASAPTDTGLEKIELRNATAKRLERVGIIAVSKDRGADLAIALDRWQQAIAYLPETEKNRRTALVSQIAAEVAQIG